MDSAGDDEDSDEEAKRGERGAAALLLTCRVRWTSQTNRLKNKIIQL